MSGTSDAAFVFAGVPWLWWLYAGVCAAAAVTDYARGKIYNWLTFPAIALGLVLAATTGWQGFVQAAAGLGVASLVFVPLFAFRIIGAGDAKLMMALGTVLGAAATVDLVMTTILIAGVGSAVLLVVHGRLRAFAAELWSFFQSLFVKALPIHWPRLDSESKAPFGIAVFLGYAVLIAKGLR